MFDGSVYFRKNDIKGIKFKQHLFVEDIRTEKKGNPELLKQRCKKHQYFSDLYGREMQQEVKEKYRNFYFRGEPEKPFGIKNARGGFYYVGAMHDSFCMHRNKQAGVSWFCFDFRSGNHMMNWQELSVPACSCGEFNGSEIIVYGADQQAPEFIGAGKPLSPELTEVRYSVGNAVIMQLQVIHQHLT